MRIKTEVTEVNLRQWEYITTQVPVNGREFLSSLPRVCTVFVSPGAQELHIEMDVTEFLTLALRLENIRNEPAVAPGPSNWGKPLPPFDSDFADRLENGAYDR